MEQRKVQAGLVGALALRQEAGPWKSFLVPSAKALPLWASIVSSAPRGNTAIVSFRTSLNSTVPGTVIIQVVTVVVTFIPVTLGGRAREPMWLQRTRWAWGLGRDGRFPQWSGRSQPRLPDLQLRSSSLGPLPGRQNQSQGHPGSAGRTRAWVQRNRLVPARQARPEGREEKG